LVFVLGISGLVLKYIVNLPTYYVITYKILFVSKGLQKWLHVKL
jgi:hypothetical protein